MLRLDQQLNAFFIREKRLNSISPRHLRKRQRGEWLLKPERIGRVQPRLKINQQRPLCRIIKLLAPQHVAQHLERDPVPQCRIAIAKTRHDPLRETPTRDHIRDFELRRLKRI